MVKEKFEIQNQTKNRGKVLAYTLWCKSGCYTPLITSDIPIPLSLQFEMRDVLCSKCDPNRANSQIGKMIHRDKGLQEDIFESVKKKFY